MRFFSEAAIDDDYKQVEIAEYLSISSSTVSKIVLKEKKKVEIHDTFPMFQILRVYKKGANGCFQPLNHALSTKLWHELSEQERFSVEEVNNPHMKFLK